MKKEDAIRTFVQKNFSLLKERENFDNKTYRASKKMFFGKELKYKYGNPPDKEICNCLVEYLIKTYKISSEAELEEVIAGTTFLKVNNIKVENYVLLIDSITKKYDIGEEIKGLKDIEKHDRLLEQIKKERTKEIDELIEQKKEEYRSLPSVLDHEDFSEPEIVTPQRTSREWWEQLNLRENPFPGPLDGLFLVDKSIYDEIIVETPPIQWALRKLDSISNGNMDIFHRGYLLGGEFGTGKTTFYDFLSLHLTMNHIEPIRIALAENISEAHYVQRFEKDICIEIAKIARKFSVPLTNRIIDFEEARFLMLEIQSKGVIGFFIFIDDLHKNLDTNRVFNFLANLQITKNVLSRDTINAVFVVAGFPSWEERIRKDSALTGFFDAADMLMLPEVSPELAAQAIKKRLQAFSINPEREIGVKEEFLRTIFRRVSSEIGRSNIGFRPYIQAAINHFQQNKFDILSIDFTSLDDSTIVQVRTKLESSDEFKKNIHALIFGTGIKKREVRELTLKILCEIYLRKGVSEDDPLFTSNRFSFQRLSQCQLIQKYDRKGKLVWDLPPYLMELNIDIRNQFNLSIEDYLIPTYSDLRPRAEVQRKREKKLEVFQKYLKEWGRRLDQVISGSLTDALDMYSRHISPYLEEDVNVLKLTEGLPEVEDLKKCVWTLMKAIIKFESPLLLEVPGESNMLGWSLRHRTLEYSQHFITMAENLKKGANEKRDITRLLSFAKEAFDELWMEFDQSLNRFEKTRVRCSEIPRKVLKTLCSEEAHLLSVIKPRQEVFESFSKVVAVLEETVRRYLLVSCTLLFGPYHLRFKHYPESIRRYITKGGVPSAISYESYNEFENLNRGQYRLLFTQVQRSSLFYRQVIEPVIDRWDSLDIETFFRLFGDFNIIAAHSKVSSIEDVRKDMLTFFRLACRFISCVSARLRELVFMKNTILLHNGEISVVFGFQHRLGQETKRILDSMKDPDIPSGFHQFRFPKDQIEKGIDEILEHSDNAFGTVELDLLDIEETSIKCRKRYSEAIPIIAIAAVLDKIRGIPLYGTDICLMRIRD
jgi:hypothetical protein